MLLLLSGRCGEERGEGAESVCGEPQKVCVKKDTPEYLIPGLCAMGGGSERAGDIREVTQHMRGTAKTQVSWVVALALDILGDPGLFPPP